MTESKTPPSPEGLRHVARLALARHCACGLCPTDDALRAVIAMSDAELAEHIIALSGEDS